MKKINWEKYNINIQENEQRDYDDDDDDSKKLPTIVQTPFGVFKLNDSLNPFNRFNFWIANTNFNITNEVKDLMDIMEGIEVFTVVSRYQFIVGIGRLFDERTIKQKIERLLCGEKSGLKAILNSTYKYWTMYQFPNMNLDYYGSNNLTDVKLMLSYYSEAQKISNGRIFKSDTLTE